MANNNFVVQNGLTVGNTTIFAGNGDVITTGNISVSGGGLSSNQIYSGSSNVTVTASTIYANIASTPVATVTGSLVTIAQPTTVVGTVTATTFSGTNVNAATIGNASAALSGATVNATTSVTTNTLNAATIGNAGAVLYGTLNSASASQPNITTLAGVTSIGTSGVTTTAAGNFTITGSLTVNGTTTTINNTTYETTEYVTTINATNVNAATIGNASAVLYGTLNSSSASQPNITTLGGVTSIGASGSTTLTGTLQTASQPNITTLAGVTSIGASGSTTLTGTLQTASQTNITAVGTLAGLTVSAAIVPNANTSVNLGSTSVWWNNIYGVTFVGTSTSAKYADLAENYQGDKFYNPGTVLMFGGANEVTLADADTTRVAGVVSTNPAHLMNGGLNGANVAAVALMGRVPCMIIGPVAKGDLLVSAGFGFAKVNNNAQPGQVIGKALADFPIAAKGVIEVVVGRL